jgi:hypothetical protein
MRIEYSRTLTKTYYKTDSDQFPQLIRTEKDKNIKWQIEIYFPDHGRDYISIIDDGIIRDLENYLHASQTPCEVDPYKLLSENILKIIKEYEN